MATSVCKKTPYDPDIIDGLAIVQGIQLCLNLSIYNLIVESDYQLLVKEIGSKEASLSFGSNITHDIKDLMTCF